MRNRPVFHAEIGLFFQTLREDRGWTVRRAAEIARQKKLSPLTRQVLFRLEKGQVKNPETDVLGAIARLYGLTYSDVAGRFIKDSYGIEIGPSDLVWQPSGGVSAANQGGSSVEAEYQARIRELESREREYKSVIAAFERIEKQIVSAMLEVPDTLRSKHAGSRENQPKARARTRKAG